jgi:hypothetical protein
LRIDRTNYADQLLINGSYNGVVDIDKDPNSMILVTARGGNGGSGGILLYIYW